LNSITFLLVVHNHQPSGNFPHVLERVHAEAYAPFLEVLSRHPGVKIAAHYSGSLLTWLEAAHPESLDRLRHLVERGQVELLTGGFYEPVLAAIPEADRRGQIRKQTEWLRERFGRKPVGLWLAERVWEPDLAGSLAEAGVRYTLLDDTHFLAAGADPQALDGPYLTEDRGRTLVVFPISKRLRYLIPFQPAEATIDFLRDEAARGSGRVFLLGDDGEKFGHWPDTHRQVYADGWLDRFFTLLEENRAWLRTGFPRDAMRPVRGRIYLPTAAYEEMGEWTLPPSLQARFHATRERLRAEDPEAMQFMQGGTWRAFLGRYPESDRMYQRGLRLREEAEAVSAAHPEAAARAMEAIWAAQCNCPFWHGVFGGIYLPHLRDAVWRQLLEAETAILGAVHEGAEWVDARHVDLDADGEDEILLRNEAWSVVVDPEEGVLSELSLRPAGIAFLNGLSRRYEAYHDRLAVSPSSGPADGVASIHDRFLVKEAGLDALLHVDRYARLSLRDHWLRSDEGPEAFREGRLPDPMDLRGPYRGAIARHDRGVTAVLRRASGGEGTAGVVVEKTIELGRSGARLEIAYRIEALAAGLPPAWFGIEWNFAMLDAGSPKRRFSIAGEQVERSLSSIGETDLAPGVVLIDRDRGVELRLSWKIPARLWWAPVETVSLSETGIERVYQSTAILPAWAWPARPGEPLLLELTLESTALA
jgi:4-alpha-glucanotransferase